MCLTYTMKKLTCVAEKEQCTTYEEVNFDVASQSPVLKVVVHHLLLLHVVVFFEFSEN